MMLALDEVQLFDRTGLLIISALVVLALLPLYIHDRRRARRNRQDRP